MVGLCRFGARETEDGLSSPSLKSPWTGTSALFVKMTTRARVVQHRLNFRGSPVSCLWHSLGTVPVFELFRQVVRWDVQRVRRLTQT